MRVHRETGLLSLWVVLLTASVGLCDVLLEETFESAGAWRKRVDEKCSIELVADGHAGRCVKIRCPEKGTAYYSVDLDPERIRGCRLKIRAMVRTEDVQQGEQVYAAAKFHVGGRSGGKPFNRAKWFVGTRDWHEETFVAPIPDDIEKPVFDLAIQSTSGTVWFDSLVIDDGLKACMVLDLAAVANTSLSDGVADDGAGGFLDTGRDNLRNVLRGDVVLGGYDFHILGPGQNHGATGVALRGIERPGFPQTPPSVKKPGNPTLSPAVVAVGRKGTGLLFLQAAGWVRPERTEPCLVYTVAYADGKLIEIPIMEGRDVGAFDSPQDLANWKVAWTETRWGKTVGLGVTTWSNPRPDIPIETISLHSPGTGAVPVVVAISLDRVDVVRK